MIFIKSVLNMNILLGQLNRTINISRNIVGVSFRSTDMIFILGSINRIGSIVEYEYWIVYN